MKDQDTVVDLIADALTGAGFGFAGTSTTKEDGSVGIDFLVFRLDVPRETTVEVDDECHVCNGTGIAGVSNGHEYPCLVCRATVDNPVDGSSDESTQRQPTKERHP